MPARTLGTEGGWIVRFHIGWRGEQSILYKGVETSLLQMESELGTGGMPTRTLGPEWVWIVRSHIG